MGTSTWSICTKSGIFSWEVWHHKSTGPTPPTDGWEDIVTCVNKSTSPRLFDFVAKVNKEWVNDFCTDTNIKEYRQLFRIPWGSWTQTMMQLEEDSSWRIHFKRTVDPFFWVVFKNKSTAPTPPIDGWETITAIGDLPRI